ncbi:MAG: thioredoxin family protein [Flavobacteriaceae bacterium]|nr:thioredoxin family protein [Flavobacteriaceae bacterium]
MKRIKLLTIIVLVLVVSAFTVKGVISKTDKGYKVGDMATDFKLMNIDEKTVSMSDFEDAKGFIIVFTCNTCPYAVMYEDRIEALNRKYASKGYPVIAIMPNSITKKPGDNLDAMKMRAKEKGFTFPYLIDKDQSIYPQYGATKTPHTYILEKTDKGNVVRYIGAIDNNYKDESKVTKKYAEDAIDALLKGEPVPKAKTKAIGCSIKA